MASWAPKQDPRPYKNGRCRRDGCNKVVPPAGRAAGDPWCSGDCCRAFHAVEIGPTDMELAREKRGRHERRKREEAAA